MKNVLVLGGTRFFGKRLVEQLVANGCVVTIATRGNLPNPKPQQVRQLIVDRTDREELRQRMKDESFDVIFDNVCQTPSDAIGACEVFRGKVGHYVMTSTMSVYDLGRALKEEEFEPTTFDVDALMGKELDYQAGKRGAEAVFSQRAEFPVGIMRIPLVVGVDDHTRRFVYYVEKVLRNEPFGVLNLDANMSYIHASEAASFLIWLASQKLTGVYNATPNGVLSMRELIGKVEALTGSVARITDGRDESTMSPFGWVEDDYYMDNTKAKNAGFRFSHVEDFIPTLITDFMSQL